MSEPETVEDAVEQAPMLEQQDIDELMQADETPCISIYVPTSPVTDRKDKNRILYKDQVKKVDGMLEQRDMDKYLRAQLLEQLEGVGVSDDFWLYQQYGLAVFVSPERFRVRRLMRAPSDLGIVADSFHLRPLLRETRHWMRYQVLCISLHDVALYDCDREVSAPVTLHNNVPRGMAEALGKTETAPNRKDHDRAGDDSKDLRQYFQRVDQAIREYHNGLTDLPLILAVVAEHQGLFREVSRNANLLEAGLESEPFELIDQRRLGEASWQVAEQALAADLDAWLERYHSLAAHGEGVSELGAVARAAAIGQIDTVLIDDQARVEGRVNAEDGSIRYGESDDARTDDVLDDIVERVLRFDGRVRFVPSERMPDDTGAAALLRYAVATG